MTDTSVIIPVLNNLADTKACVKALRAAQDSAAAEVIIADNGSTDGTAAWAVSEGLRVAGSSVNEGFARACNRGAAAASGEYLVFLNNDTLPGPGWLAALRRASLETGAGIAGGKLLFPDGSIQHAGVTVRADGMPEHFLRGLPYAGEAFVNKRRYFHAVSAACMLVRKELFYAASGFDAAFVNGYEDVDFCLRAARLGSGSLYEPACEVVHFESRTAGRFAAEEANRELFLSRWAGRAAPDDAGLKMEFFEGLTGRPQSYCTIVTGPGSPAQLGRCLAMLASGAVESQQAHRVIVADYGAPGWAAAAAEARNLGLDVVVDKASAGLEPVGLMRRAAAVYGAEYTALVAAGAVVPPGWAHRLAMHLKREPRALAGPVYAGLKGRQGLDLKGLFRPGAPVRLNEAALKVFSARRGKSSGAEGLLPYCLMARSAALLEGCKGARVAEDTLVHMEVEK